MKLSIQCTGKLKLTKNLITNMWTSP